MLPLELASLQASLNTSLDVVQDELHLCGLPPLSSSGTSRHPLDDPAFESSPRLYEARRLALGLPTVTVMVFHASDTRSRQQLWSVDASSEISSTDAHQTQLKHLLQPPFEKVVEQSFAVYDSACLDIVVRTRVIDELAADQSSAGIHVSELQRRLDIDQKKLNIVLSYMTSQGWFQQKAEGIFALARPALELAMGRNGRKWSL